MTPDDAKKILTGPIPTLRTPFTRDGEVDEESLPRMIDFDIGLQSQIQTFIHYRNTVVANCSTHQNFIAYLYFN